MKAAHSGGQVEVYVRDQGPGIPPDKLEHVFDRFYRGDGTSTIPGFGLGLPIAKVLVEGMGGMITIKSRLGQGSTVVMNFLAGNIIER